MGRTITCLQSMINRIFIDSNTAVRDAVELLRNGAVIAIPTDTVYGLAAHAHNAAAIKSLYEIKRREHLKPIAISVSEVKDIAHWAKTDHLPDGLLEALLPGAVTVVLKRRNNLNPLLNPTYEDVGVRVPESSFIQRVAYELGDALALTSANVSTEPSPLQVEEFKDLWPHLGGVFDGGPLKGSRNGSTVIKLSTPGKFSVIREGSVLESTISTLAMFHLNRESF